MRSNSVTSDLLESTLVAVSPLSLHLVGLGLVVITTSRVKVDSALKRGMLGLILCIGIITLGYFKTSTGENLFRKLKVSRSPTVKDIQQGLDRVEQFLDEDTVAEMEEKLTGKVSSYYLKGIH